MQPWDTSNIEILASESGNTSEKIARSQRNDNVQWTDEAYLKHSDTKGPDINVTSGTLYDKVLHELEEHFEQV
jgi:hypothetical protein